MNSERRLSLEFSNFDLVRLKCTFSFIFVDQNWVYLHEYIVLLILMSQITRFLCNFLGPKFASVLYLRLFSSLIPIDVFSFYQQSMPRKSNAKDFSNYKDIPHIRAGNTMMRIERNKKENNVAIKKHFVVLND